MTDNSTCKKYLEQSDSERQKVAGSCQGLELGENEELLFMGQRISDLQKEESSVDKQ